MNKLTIEYFEAIERMAERNKEARQALFDTWFGQMVMGKKHQIEAESDLRALKQAKKRKE